MCRLSIILIALFTALGTAAAQQDCTTGIPKASRLEQSFSITTKETIQKGTQCTWTIEADNPQKVLVYLKVDGAATETQCVTVENESSNDPKPICGKQKENTFTSTGQRVTVKYTYSGDLASVPNFSVMYKFANNAYCTATSPMATDTEQSFDVIQSQGTIPENVYCSWTITVPSSQRIMVRLTTDTTTENQCVSVSNKPNETGQKICGKQGENTFTSEGQEVTVTYPTPEPAKDVKNFKVFYIAENSKECSTNIPDASTVQQAFPITTTSTIPKGTQCTWTIKTTDPQKILVYLTVNGTATETQCVTVDNNPTGSPKTICGKQSDNTFTSTGQTVTVKYTYNGQSETAPNFMVMYKFANSDACTVTSPMATDSEQSFGIIKTEEIIPANVHCSWAITAPSPKKVMVHLMVEGTSTENQCVSASNNPNEAGQKICGKANENTFTSEGQQMTITYPASNPASGVKNFKVFYMTSRARRDTAWIARILPVYILSKLLL